jgi:flagellar protein FlgJ
MGAATLPLPGDAGAIARTASSARTAPKDPRLLKQAQDFETMFLETTLGHLMSGLNGDGPMGAGSPGSGQDTWRGMLTQQYARTISRSGGIGIADSVYRELVKLQGQSGPAGVAHAG